MPLRLLPQHLINRIAAGEVVERPGSAVKELVENALDAGASRIDVTISRSGRNLIRIQDDGKGMNESELELCLLRHATSKLDDDDLWNIRSMGFRGEALASIASISRIVVRSKKRDTDSGWEVACEGGGEQVMRPCVTPDGTCVEVKDLFFATPARLKFLKSDRTEQAHIEEQLFRLSLAYPSVRFSLKDDKGEAFTLECEGADAEERRFFRVCAVTDPAFKDNSIPVREERDDGYALTGYAGLPTFHRSAAHHLYLFVNDRPVRDKLLLSAVRAAYQDYLPRMRYPVAALFLNLPAADVDVNVHPAKAEVRFRHDDRVRSILIGGLRRALGGGAYRSSAAAAEQALRLAEPSVPVPVYTPSFLPGLGRASAAAAVSQEGAREQAPAAYDEITGECGFREDAPASLAAESVLSPAPSPELRPAAISANAVPARFEQARPAERSANAFWNSHPAAARAFSATTIERKEFTPPREPFVPPVSASAFLGGGAPSRPVPAATEEDASFQSAAVSSVAPPFAAAPYAKAEPISDRASDAAPAGVAVMPAEGGGALDHAAPAGVDLGRAMCSVFANYIIAQTDDALVIVDQHAAHERLRYERFKREYREGGVLAQPLLTPEIVDLSPQDFALIEPVCPILAKAGLRMAPFGKAAVIVRATPAIFGVCHVRELVTGIIDDLRSYGDPHLLVEKADEILSSVACKGAIKAGDQLRPEEMDYLLRSMERTPYSGQCNHGRPTYVKLHLKDIERLFGRT